MNDRTRDYRALRRLCAQRERIVARIVAASAACFSNELAQNPKLARFAGLKPE
jgi:hypothetical protein